MGHVSLGRHKTNEDGAVSVEEGIKESRSGSDLIEQFSSYEQGSATLPLHPGQHRASSLLTQQTKTHEQPKEGGCSTLVSEQRLETTFKTYGYKEEG